MTLLKSAFSCAQSKYMSEASTLIMQHNEIGKCTFVDRIINAL